MDSIYNRLIELQYEIIQNTIEYNSVIPILPTLAVAQLQVEFTKEAADDILRTIKRSAPFKKAKKLTSLPLFKVWFFRILLNKINLEPAAWDTLMTFGNVETLECSITSMSQLDSFFQEGIMTFFEASTFQGVYAGYGLHLMAQINKDYTILGNLNEVLMLKQLYKSINEGAYERLLEEAQIVGYYIPSQSDSVVRMILASQETPNLRKLFLNNNWNNKNKSCFDISNLGTIVKELKENNITDTNEPYPEIMLSSTSAAKLSKKKKFQNRNNQTYENKSNNKNKKKNKKHNNYRSNGKRSGGGSSNNFYAEFDSDSEYESDYYTEVVDQIRCSDEISEEIYNLSINSKKYQKLKKASFIVDTGATTHVVNDKRLFSYCRKTKVAVNSVHGKRHIEYIGTVKVGKLTLHDVLYIPSSTKNIISLAKIIDGTGGYQWDGNDSIIRIRKGESVVALAEKEGKFFWLHSGKVDTPTIFNVENVSSDIIKEIRMAHIALGHASPQRIKIYLERTTGTKLGVHAIQKEIKNCECGQVNVQKKRGSKLKTKKSYAVGEMIHLDVIGPIDNKYAILGTDRESNYVVSKIMNSRSEVSNSAINILKHFQNLLQLRNLSICFVRADNEFRSMKFRQFCSNNGIIIQNTAPYSSYQNGTAEVMNKIIQYKMRKLMQVANVPSKYWTYAFNHAVFLHNHFDFKTNGQTPWELFRKQNYEIKRADQLPPFGCKISSYNNHLVQKVFRENYSGVFLGYSDTTKIAFILLNNDKIIRSSSFQTFNNYFPFRVPHSRAIDEYEHDDDGYTFNSGGFSGSTGFSTTSMNHASQNSPAKLKRVINSSTKSNKAPKTNNNSLVINNQDINNENNTNNKSSQQASFENSAQSNLQIENITEKSLLPIAKATATDANDQNIEQPKEDAIETYKSSSLNEVSETTSTTTASKVDNIDDPTLPDSDSLSVSNQPPENEIQENNTSNVTQSVNNTKSSLKAQSKKKSLPLTIDSKVSSKSKITKPTIKKNKIDKSIVESANIQSKHVKSKPKESTSTPTDSSGQSKRSNSSKHNDEPPTKKSRSLQTLTSSTSSEQPMRNVSKSTKAKQNNLQVVPIIPLKRKNPNTDPITVDNTSNPFKRITRSITRCLSIAGENNMSNNNASTIDKNQQINLLVSNDKYVIPTTFKQAMNLPQKKEWKKACEEEMKAMKKLRVYQRINKNQIKDKSIIKGRWVFNVKQESDGTERFKARLVAKGFTQELGQNYLETFSPVIALDSIRYLLSLSAINGWNICQMDAKNAFLNGKLKYEIYFQPPDGCGMQQNEVWKLNKALYGLKNAPLIFYHTMLNVLKKEGFESSLLDPCIIYHKKMKIYIAMYVDDLLIFGQSQENINKTKKLLSRNFEMKDLGTPKIFLGMTIKHYNKYHMKLSMENTIDKLEKDYNIKVKERKVSTPIEKGFKADDEESPILNEEEHNQFRKVIGSLLYIANTVRLDISYPVSLLSRYLVTPRKCHLKAAYRIIHYLIQTKKRGLHYTNEKTLQIPTKDYRLLDTNKKAIIQDYPKQGEYLITTITDASFANEENRHSQSGSITYLNNNIITWMSKRQTLVALSSAEAEYIGMTEALKSAIHFNNLLKELKFKRTYAKICCDNVAALQLSSHKIHHQRTKHIDLRYHFIRERIQSKQIKLDYINTKFNTADCLTKLVSPQTMKTLDSILFSKDTRSIIG